MEYYVSAFTPALRIEFHSADVWVIDGEFVYTEVFEI
jgi:hypothetical protein